MMTYWGVPLDSFTPAPNHLLRQQLGIDDAFVAGYVGRIVEEKGLNSLLHAISILPSEVHLLCVGDGPWLQTFKRKILAHGIEKRVHHFDRVDDDQVAGYFNALDALVLPSLTTDGWKEQFGRVLPEAMACGVPVIGSDSGEIPQVIGDAGLIFPEDDSDALAATIRELRDQPRRRNDLIDKGVCRAHEQFSCQAFAAKLVTLFEQVCAKGSKRSMSG